MELQELIKTYPELGEVFAEFENRISFLENSLPYQTKKEIIKETVIERQDLRPIKSEVNYILNKINTHIDASKSKRVGYKHTIK